MAFEMMSSTRRSTRRSVELACDVLSPASGLGRERMVDLSTRGACVTSGAPIGLDEEIVVAFTPPGMRASIEALARVAHAARPLVRGIQLPDRIDSLLVGSAMVGIEFTSLPSSAYRDIERALRGLPPPLPSSARRIELAWIDVEMSWEEELGDQLNMFSKSERVTMVDDGIELIEVVAPAAAMRLPVHLRGLGLA